MRLKKFEKLYFRNRNKDKAHSMIVKSFKKSGLTHAQLAQCLGTTKSKIASILASPSYLTLDLISDILLACEKREVAWQSKVIQEVAPRTTDEAQS